MSDGDKCYEENEVGVKLKEIESQETRVGECGVRAILFYQGISGKDFLIN